MDSTDTTFPTITVNTSYDAWIVANYVTAARNLRSIYAEVAGQAEAAGQRLAEGKSPYTLSANLIAEVASAQTAFATHTDLIGRVALTPADLHHAMTADMVRIVVAGEER